MADYVDTKVSNLVINNLTQEKYDELLASGQINPDELYCTPDTRASAVLFEAKWFDHIVDDMSWLRADNFTWHSGDVYKSAYEHLASEYEAETTLGQQTDTIDGITIYYRLAEDGHKIVPADREADVQALYEKTGVAWYYILDQANKQFKLPRTKFGFTGLRDAVGGYVTPGLPNITGSFYFSDNIVKNDNTAVYVGGVSGAFSAEPLTANTCAAAQSPTIKTVESANRRVNFNASNLSGIYGNGDTVQPPATQMYLYFYVGNFTKSAVEQTAGITSEQLNDKADDSSVVHKTGDEAIGGVKTFTGSITLESANNEIKFINPNNSAFYGFIRASSTGFVIGTKTDDAWNKTITFTDTGMTASTPAASSNGTTIATTAFVKSVLSSSGNGLATFSKAANGYYKFSNGLIVQWMQITGWDGFSTILRNWPTAFSSATSYKAIAGWAGTIESAYPITVSEQTSAGVKLQVYQGLGGQGRNITVIGIGY